MGFIGLQEGLGSVNMRIAFSKRPLTRADHAKSWPGLKVQGSCSARTSQSCLQGVKRVEPDWLFLPQDLRDIQIPETVTLHRSLATL